MINLIFLGPPGVGKGTQARAAANRLGVPAISTGHIFRANMQARTELGTIAQEYLDHGRLVPDAVTNPMVRARLAAPDISAGFVLDGYPRTLEQAYALRDLLAQNQIKLNLVVNIEAPREVLLRHILKRAQIENRTDDTAEVFQQRMIEYQEQTEPIATYYADHDLLANVDGVGTIDEVFERVLDTLRQHGIDVPEK